MPHSVQSNESIYGPGSFTDTEFTPVPKESERLLKYFIDKTPGFNASPEDLKNVNFHGADLPVLPGPIKAQALSAVVHAMIGLVSHQISKIKGLDAGTIDIDTDHAGLYPAMTGAVSIGGKPLADLLKDDVSGKVGYNVEGGFLDGPMRYRSWAIYPTKDPKVYFQPLASLTPLVWLKAFNLDPNAASTLDEAYEIIGNELKKYSARELEQISIEHGFCGSQAFSPKAWNETVVAKNMTRHPLVNYKQITVVPDIPPVPFPKSQDLRPLAGIKVVELSRVIAAPVMGSILASLGAEVIRVQPPHLHDFQQLNLTLTAGKRTCGLNLNEEKDRKHLEDLIADADVFVQSFRLRSLERRGFGLPQLLEIANKRGKGIVYVDLNCYGLDGYYAERPGFQQIADAASGCEYVLGKAYGFDEGVAILPSLPISDMLTGAVGAVEVLLALRDRATKGGSYHANAALLGLDMAQLEREVGLYQPEIVKTIQEKYNFGKMTPDLMVSEVQNVILEAWEKSSNLLKRDEFFTRFEQTPFGKDHRIVAPVAKLQNKAITPAWTWGPVPYCWEKYPKFVS